MKTKPADSIFLSYRRSDSPDVTGRIYDHLIVHFNRDAVFKDVDSIPAGVDFRQYIADAVGSCAVVLAVIGPGWIMASREDGTRRLDDPDDFVRLELEAALQRKIPVIPTLVGTSQMPVLAIVLLKLLQFRSRLGWALSNLVALLRWNLFTYRDLWKWIDDPYAHAPPQGDPWQLHLFLDSITQP